MHFPVSGVECPFWLPPLAAFAVALLATPAGVSGAFLLLPFQMSVLGFVSPGVTPTNLIYNVVAVPGGIWRFIREQRMDWRLAGAVIAGTAPGVIVGAIVRVRYLPDPRYIRVFVAAVLLYLAVRLLRQAAPGPGLRKPGERLPTSRLTAVALVVGLIGGIYGVGGGAIIAPFAMTSLCLPARAVAGPALAGTFVTSLVGIASFELIGRSALATGVAVRPDWVLGLLFGAGGLAGSYCGARLQKHLPERWIRLGLGVLLLCLAARYFTDTISQIGWNGIKIALIRRSL